MIMDAKHRLIILSSKLVCLLDVGTYGSTKIESSLTEIWMFATTSLKRPSSLSSIGLSPA
jgi:hypothetical protein